MASRQEVMKTAMELAENNLVITSLDLQACGYARNTVQLALTQLASEGKLERTVKGKMNYWGLPGNKPKESKPIDLDGLPDSLLFMMGYTRHQPLEIGVIYETR